MTEPEMIGTVAITDGVVATPAPSVHLRVKQLEWKDYPGSRLTGENKERYGFHEFGSYLITRDGGFYSLSTFTNMGAMRPMGDFKQLDDATGAAQADFDQRVLSIVTPTPAQKPLVSAPANTSGRETQEFTLRAMASNYRDGHSWDHLDGEACEKAADEISSLRAMLFPYADATEISGVSWDGKYLIGDKTSIKFFHEMKNRGEQIDVYRRAYDERISASEAQISALKSRIQGLEEAGQAYVSSVSGEPEKDCWDTEDGKEAPAAERFASDWAWKAYDDKKQQAFDALRAALNKDEKHD